MDTEQTIRVLLIDGDPKGSQRIKGCLAKATNVTFDVQSSRKLTLAMEQLVQSKFDVVLLDLSLRETGELDSLAVIRDYAPDIPVVAFGPREMVGTGVLARGAYGYVTHDQMNTNVLLHMLVQAAEYRAVTKQREVGEGHFRALIENSTDAIMVVDSSGAVRYGSPSFRRLLGYGESERLGSSILEFLHPDDLEIIARLFGKLVAQDGATVSVQARVLHKDGSWRYVEAIGSNHLENTAVQGIVINMRDITERKQADEALRASEERYRLIAENMTDLIFILDLDLRVKYASPSVTKLLGYTTKEIEKGIGGTIDQVIPPEYLERGAKILAEELAAESAGREGNHATRSFELEFLRKDGSRVWVEEVTSFIRDAEGKPTAILGVARDISERKQTERELQEREARIKQIFDTVSEEIVLVDLTGKVVEVNQGVQRIFGFSPEEVMGRNFVELNAFEADQLAVLTKVFADSVADGQVLDTFVEVRATRKDGQEIYVEPKVAAMKGADGQLEGFLCAIRDITERKHAEEAAKRADEKLKEAMEKLRLSHEALSTPVVQIWDRVLALPLIGVVDDRRAQKVMEALLKRIVETQSEIVILDVTGVAAMDSGVTHHLFKTIRSVSLLGAQCILTGIRSDVAQVMMDLGLDTGTVVIKRDMQDGLKWALHALGNDGAITPSLFQRNASSALTAKSMAII